jgi:pimeloyl-ACP methyl ester carboxylesterase
LSARSSALAVDESQATISRQTVILVHGLWMHGMVLVAHRHWLSRHGYAVASFSYPSMRQDLSVNAQALAGFVAGTAGAIIHLVGHSLGGLVVLAMLAKNRDARVRRAVLMGSPSDGCHAAALLARTPVVSGIIGASMREWLSCAVPQLPAALEVGVLAGNRSCGLGKILPGLPRPNDGVIGVAETRLPQARDAIVLPVSHTGMLFSRACNDQLVAFLGQGRFRHA